MPVESKEKLSTARKLMDDFAQRTGLYGKDGDTGARYLWTDAFAVQTFFNLAHIHSFDLYHGLAVKLIDEVHQNLGRFHANDKRKGWISGLSEEQGLKHPTAGGLRIGKKLAERKQDEPLDERLEWERDGQYFHYLTRWIHALLQAEQETKEKTYAIWAAELLEAGGKFIEETGGRTRMYWKMSIDLSRPLINKMGAHDPLEGLICALSIVERVPEKESQLHPTIDDLKDCCRGLDWATTDPLGIGGLLLNITRLTDMTERNDDLPENVRPGKLLADCLYGLAAYSRMHHPNVPASQRLAFRECGLSLGLNTLMRLKEKLTKSDSALNKLDQFIYLADEIERFWIDPQNQNSPTWTEHLNINAVSLATSLVASNIS
jgi:hypothetical protein